MLQVPPSVRGGERDGLVEKGPKEGGSYRKPEPEEVEKEKIEYKEMAKGQEDPFAREYLTLDPAEEREKSWETQVSIDEHSKVQSSPDGRVLCIWTKDKADKQNPTSSFLVKELDADSKVSPMKTTGSNELFIRDFAFSGDSKWLFVLKSNEISVISIISPVSPTFSTNKIVDFSEQEFLKKNAADLQHIQDHNNFKFFYCYHPGFGEQRYYDAARIVLVAGFINFMIVTIIQMDNSVEPHKSKMKTFKVDAPKYKETLNLSLKFDKVTEENKNQKIIEDKGEKEDTPKLAEFYHNSKNQICVKATTDKGKQVMRVYALDWEHPSKNKRFIVQNTVEIPTYLDLYFDTISIDGDCVYCINNKVGAVQVLYFEGFKLETVFKLVGKKRFVKHLAVKDDGKYLLLVDTSYAAEVYVETKGGYVLINSFNSNINEPDVEEHPQPEPTLKPTPSSAADGVTKGKETDKKQQGVKKKKKNIVEHPLTGMHFLADGSGIVYGHKKVLKKQALFLQKPLLNNCIQVNGRWIDHGPFRRIDNCIVAGAYILDPDEYEPIDISCQKIVDFRSNPPVRTMPLVPAVPVKNAKDIRKADQFYYREERILDTNTLISYDEMKADNMIRAQIGSDCIMTKSSDFDGDVDNECIGEYPQPIVEIGLTQNSRYRIFALPIKKLLVCFRKDDFELAEPVWSLKLPQKEKFDLLTGEEPGESEPSEENPEDEEDDEEDTYLVMDRLGYKGETLIVFMGGDPDSECYHLVNIKDGRILGYFPGYARVCQINEQYLVAVMVQDHYMGEKVPDVFLIHIESKKAEPINEQFKGLAAKGEGEWIFNPNLTNPRYFFYADRNSIFRVDGSTNKVESLILNKDGDEPLECMTPSVENHYAIMSKDEQYLCIASVKNSDTIYVIHVESLIKREIVVKPRTDPLNRWCFSHDSRFLLIRCNESILIFSMAPTQNKEIQMRAIGSVPLEEFIYKYTKIISISLNESSTELEIVTGYKQFILFRRMPFYAVKEDLLLREIREKMDAYSKLSGKEKITRAEEISGLMTVQPEYQKYFNSTYFNLLTIFPYASATKRYIGLLEDKEILFKYSNFEEKCITEKEIKFGCIDPFIEAIGNYMEENKRMPTVKRENLLKWMESEQLSTKNLRKLLELISFEPMSVQLYGELKDEWKMILPIEAEKKYHQRSANWFEKQKKKLFLDNSANATVYNCFKTSIEFDLSNGSEFSMAYFDFISKASDEDLKGKYKVFIVYKWNEIYIPAAIYSILFWILNALYCAFMGFVPDSKVLGGIIITMNILFILYEIKCAAFFLNTFFKDFWNWYDIGIHSFSIICVAILLADKSTENGHDRSIGLNWLRVISFCIISVRGITMLRIFEGCRYLITMLFAVFYDMIIFLSVFCYAIFIYWFICLVRPALVDEGKDEAFFESVRQSLNIAFSNFDASDLSVIGLSTTVLGQIVLGLVLLNYLIAIVSKTYESITEEKALYDVKLLLELIKEFDSFFYKMKKPKEENKLYYLSVIPAPDSIENKVNFVEMEKNMKRILRDQADLKTNYEDKHDALVALLNKMIEREKERDKDYKESQQQLNKQIKNIMKWKRSATQAGPQESDIRKSDLKDSQFIQNVKPEDLLIQMRSEQATDQQTAGGDSEKDDSEESEDVDHSEQFSAEQEEGSGEQDNQQEEEADESEDSDE